MASLLDLLKSEKGRVLSVNTEKSLASRLMIMGIRSGSTVTMIKNAPLKDPVEFAIGNTHLSINRKEAKCIAIEKLS